MEKEKSKLLVVYDGGRYPEEFVLEHVIEPYLYFLTEKSPAPLLDPSKKPEEHYEKKDIHGNLKGFEVVC